jgi:hypothetical protein
MNVNATMSNQFFQYKQTAVSFQQGSIEQNKTLKSFSFEFSHVDFSFQSHLGALGENIKPPQSFSDFIDYDAIGYSGKPIESLSQGEAKKLVAEDGFFGAAQTAERIAGFVVNGAGDDLERLQEGRKGVIQGFEEAEAMWGQKLFDISYDTLAKALETIDARIAELGGSVLNVEA